MTLYVSMPSELFGQDLTDVWNRLEYKLKQEYRGWTITSNYTGVGRLEDADIVIFLQEYKENESCKRDMKRCRELDIQYNFFAKFYAPDRFFYPSPTQSPFDNLI